MLLAKKKTNKIIESKGDRVLSAFTTVILIAILIIVGYPVLYVVSCSFSSTEALQLGRVVLWPVEPTLAGYEFVFKYQNVWIGYRNTIFYTVFGVMATLGIEILCAYPLSRSNYQGKSFMTKYFFITTMISAGLIPTFMVKAQLLGMKDSVWAVLLAGILAFSQVVILRTALKAVPSDLYDAAAIDGASEFQIMTQVALPLVKATTMVLVLYSAIGCWNDYFNAMIYLDEEALFPLQLFLRTILTAAQAIKMDDNYDPSMLEQVEKGVEQIQYALIVVSTVPVLIFYYVVQGSFKKGIMIGSIKG